MFWGLFNGKRKVLGQGQKSRLSHPTKNMGVLSCKGVGGVHNVSFLGSDDGVSSEDKLVWQFEIFAHKDAEVDLDAGDSIALEVNGEKVTG